jgi:Holliday junction DNA helicase RuvA
MIALLTGTVSSKAPDHCVIDVGGVGYKVLVSLTTFGSLPEVGSTLSLQIHTYVREDQLELFGFSSPEERELFQRLISISGVGPKMALGVLSGLPPRELAEAIGNEDHVRLTRIPGVGRKTADRIIVELKDRLKAFTGPGPVGAPGKISGCFDQALSALVNLGYTRQVAEGALRRLDWPKDWPLEEAIRCALKELCRS